LAVAVRGIRGATTVEKNDREEILEATFELLKIIVQENDLVSEDIASIIFTVTNDLNEAFPAEAARDLLGWKYVPLLCMNEMNAPGKLGMCIRVLLHVNTERPQQEIRHVYLRKASQLRPDLSLL